MAIQISGVTVIEDNRRVGAGLSSIYSDILVSTNNTPALNRHVVYVSSNNQNIPLVQSPKIGNEVLIIVGNYTGVTIGRNTNKIMGLAENMTIDIPYAPVRLIYIDDTLGWVIS